MSAKRCPGGTLKVGAPMLLVIRTLEMLADSLHVSRLVWPTSIVEGEATRLLIVGGRVIRTVVEAVVGNGGEPGVQDTVRVADMV